MPFRPSPRHILPLVLCLVLLPPAAPLLPDSAASKLTHYDELIEQVFPAKRSATSLPSRDVLLQYDKIIVAGESGVGTLGGRVRDMAHLVTALPDPPGPQRSGTTFTTEYLARSLNYTFLDEQSPTTYLHHHRSGAAFLCNGW